MLRSPTTMIALESLATWGYVGSRRRRNACRRLPLPAHPRAPASSCTGCAARTRCPTTRRSCAGSAGRSGFRQDPVGRAGADVAAARARGATPAREALLPAAAPGGRPARCGRGTAEPGGRRAAAAGPRLRRSAERAAPPAGAHGRGEQARGDPAHPAARHARLVRRCPRPGRGPARLPAGERRPRVDALVPQAAARRVGRGGAPRPRAGHQPLRHRPPAPGARVGVDAGGRGRPGAPLARRAARRGPVRRRPA